MKKIMGSLALLAISVASFSATESTPFGKIVGIESRSWGYHVQTDFGAGSSHDCPVTPGQTYMYEFHHDNSRNGEDSSDEVSMIFTAFAAQKDIAFHIYGCNESGTRPVIGFVRLKN